MSNLENFSKPRNSFTGTFGTGQVQFFGENGTFTVPAGITSVRVRVWGNGGQGGNLASGGGGGGGFAMKTITGLTSGSNITVTIGQYYDSGATCSFGTYVSATGGGNTNANTGGAGGTGVGGDINNTGGSGSDANNTNYSGGSGGCASLFGGGGNGFYSNVQDQAVPIFGASGSGRVSNNLGRPSGGRVYSDMRRSNTYDWSDLDFIGCGSAYSNTGDPDTLDAFNGGASGGSYRAAMPGGGYGSPQTFSYGFGRGLIIVEY